MTVVERRPPYVAPIMVLTTPMPLRLPTGPSQHRSQLQEPLAAVIPLEPRTSSEHGRGGGRSRNALRRNFFRSLWNVLIGRPPEMATVRPLRPTASGTDTLTGQQAQVAYAAAVRRQAAGRRAERRAQRTAERRGERRGPDGAA